MRYIGTFKDVNDKTFTIDIITNNDPSTAKHVILGDTPIITDIEGEDNLFKPVKYSSATIKIVSDNLLYDMYSGKAQGTKVILHSGSDIKWVGYLTPNIYNLDFECDLEEIELEAIDGLSTLQYIDYSTPKKQFKSFTTLISEILNLCNCYKYFFLPYSFLPDDKTTERFYSKCQVSESNFFDEDNEPMKCDEVLEELCKFMGVTAVAYGRDVYFLDYNAIKLDLSTYYKVEVGKEDGLLDMVLHDKQSISKDSYTENGTLISLGDTYSKVSVKDSLYSADTIIPKVDELDYLSNRNGIDMYEETQINYIASDTSDTVLCKSFNKFYDHLYYQPYYYDKVSLEPTQNKPKKYDDLFNTVGATIVKNYTHTYKEFEYENDPVHKLNFDTYILVHNNNKQDGQVRKVMDIIIPNPLAVTSRGSYIVLNGSVIYNNRNKIDPNTVFTEKDEIDRFDGRILGLDVMIKYGDQYYNGSDWVSTETSTMIPLECGNVLQSKGKEHLFHTTYSFKNNVTFDMGLSEDTGYTIKIPNNANLTDGLTISILQPKSIPLIDKSDNSDKTQELTAFWISKFECAIQIPNYTDDKEFDSDTEYSNIIDESYVNDFEGEDFKICTWDNKEANYSSVVYKNSDNTDKYLDNIYCKSTKEFLRSEEHYINRVAALYSNPPFILEASLHNNVKPYSVFTTSLFGGSKSLVVDSLSIDWRLDTNRVKLIEKK